MPEQTTNELPDELNPEFMFETITSPLLAMAIRGEIDLLALAKKELAARGQDLDCNWVGFARARRLLGLD